MIIIKNSKELKKLVNEHKDLIYPDDDIRIEFEPTKDEIRNVECRNLYLENDDDGFNFNGGDFNGWNFNGWDFNGWDFNGGNFNGKKISYNSFFCCYGKIKCEECEARADKYHDPISLTGEIEIVKKKEDTVERTVEGKTKRISRQSAKELNLID